MSRHICNLILLILILIASPSKPGAEVQTRIDRDFSESGIPGFWDPRTRLEGVDAPSGRTFHILTSDDFPPLHFGGPDALPTGFSVELARLACEALRVACTIQARSFPTLLDALADGEADIIAAAVRLDDVHESGLTATLPYFRFPARFAVHAEAGRSGTGLPPRAGDKVAVMRGTAHEAFLRRRFPEADILTVADLPVAQRMLMRGEVDYVFGDGLALAVWLGGRASRECCHFAGQPYLDTHYFGEGIGFVMRAEDRQLAQAFDEALHRIWSAGDFARTWLAFFPVSPFEPPGPLVTQSP